jgi:transcriptional regulator with XRE-family HTH domain
VSEQTPPDVGAQIRVLRAERGLSLRGLAEVSQLSPNTISLIERGITSPSVSTLHRMATAMRVPITAFFEEGEERVDLVLLRSDERARSGSASVLLESLGTGLADQTLAPFLVNMKPGASSGRPVMVHVGHEMVFCLEGRIEYVIDDQPYVLEAGDSLLFEARLPHRWRNPGSEPGIFLLILQASALEESIEQHIHP